VTSEACRRWRESLGAYLLGHLSAEECVGLEAHLDGCAECRAELAELRPVSGALAAADPAHLGEPPSPPPELADRVFALLRSAQRGRRRRRWSIGAAAGIAAAVVALSVSLALRPSGHDDAEKFEFTALPAGVSAEATLYRRTPGVEVWIEVKGLTPGTTYAVWVERATGERVGCGTFNAVRGDAHVVLPSTVQRRDTAAVGVSTSDGALVMRAPVTPPREA